MSQTLSDTKLTPAVRAELDLLSVDQLTIKFGPGNLETEYAATTYWKPGDGRPVVTFEDDPAAAQAAGRCAASRTRFAGIFAGPSIHPSRCGWCDYPQDVLLAALDHAAFHSRFITAEYLWWGAKGGSYARPTNRAGTYENPRWAAFFDMDPPLRAKAIEHAAEREVTA